MRILSSLANALVAGALAASLLAGCDDHEDEDVDGEGCEHLTMGPYADVIATSTRDAQASLVADDHKAYRITLPATPPGHVRLQSDEEVEVVLFLDQDVPVKVLTSSGEQVGFHNTANRSPACPEIKGRHTVPLTVGEHFIEIGAAGGGTPVGLVIEEAAEHGH